VNERVAGVTSAAGVMSGLTKQNQDSSFVLERARGGDDFLCGVVDGHGPEGHHVAEFIKQQLGPTILERRHASGRLGTRAAMVDAFKSTAEKLRLRSDMDAKESGAVVAVCMRRGSDLYVANAGDTRAVLACQDDTTGHISVTPLTRDHTPALESEKDRIRASGGQIAPIMQPAMGFMGPPRVWRKSQVDGGLAVTRAIGDTALRSVGVTPEPEVKKHRIRACDKLVVLASDGCWDHISNDRAARIALTHKKDPQRASNEIVKEARASWHRSGGRNAYVDDITCVVTRVC